MHKINLDCSQSPFSLKVRRVCDPRERAGKIEKKNHYVVSSQFRAADYFERETNCKQSKKSQKKFILG